MTETSSQPAPKYLGSNCRAVNRPELSRWPRFLLRFALACAMLWLAAALGAQTVQMGWWEEFSLARIFDSPIVFGTVMGICGLFVVFYIVVAVRAAALERAAAEWAGSRRLTELVAALDTSDAQLAFACIRHLRSERLYTWLLKQPSAETAAEKAERLLADLPDDQESKSLKNDLASSESDKKTRREALLRVFERRDEQLQRLLMARLRETRDGGSVSVHVVYLLEDLAASEARPLLERLLSRGDLPQSILRNALRRIPKSQEAKAK